MPFVRLVTDVTYVFPVFVSDNGVVSETKFREAQAGDAEESIISFQMRQLKNDETSQIDDNTMVTKGTSTKYLVGTARIAKIKKCIVGWSGLLDGDGGEIKFNHANLNALPGPLIKVLDRHIIDINGLREDEEKN